MGYIILESSVVSQRLYDKRYNSDLVTITDSIPFTFSMIPIENSGILLSKGRIVVSFLKVVHSTNFPVYF